MRVLLFAQVKDAVGTAELEIQISGNATADEVWRKLIEAKPPLAPFQKTTRLARNGEYADAQTLFCDSDEVALIPPVSGG
jgi:molybdopterin converting factor subunit 1